jgi:hypothetical protein
MTTLTEKIIEVGFYDHVLTDVDLNSLLDGTPAARYGMVNKALKKKELIKIRRGLYLLADKYRRKKLSKVFLASRIVPHSYISLETALSYHGWIPEYVSTVTSVIPCGRTKQFITVYGEFIFYHLSINEYEFLTGVVRTEEVEGKPFLLASPLRALADLVHLKKIEWQSLSFLTEGLRIDREQLLQISPAQFQEIKKVYRSKRVLRFLKKLNEELTKNEY